MQNTVSNLPKPGNEPVLSYAPKTKERELLQAQIKKMEAEQIEIPVIIAGKEYGTGSSRHWAAKGTVLLGVRAVLAESFERIHRSNLVGMGVLPLQFREGESAATYNLVGEEKYTIEGIADLQPRQDVEVTVTRDSGEEFRFTARCRIDTFNELEYFRAGGILQYVLRKLAAA